MNSQDYKQPALEPQLFALLQTLLQQNDSQAIVRILTHSLQEMPEIEEAMVCHHDRLYRPGEGWSRCQHCQSLPLQDETAKLTDFCGLPVDLLVQYVPLDSSGPGPVAGEHSFDHKITPDLWGFLIIRLTEQNPSLLFSLQTLARTAGSQLTRLQAQQRLQRTIQTRNLIQEMTGTGHWELDLVEDHLHWSDEIYRIFGVEPESFPATYHAFLSFVHPEDREKVDHTYQSSVRNKQSYSITHRVVRHDGEVRYVEERCVHELNFGSEVVRSIGTVHDITETVHHEHYRERNEKSKDLLLKLNRDLTSISQEDLINRSLDIATEITGSKISYLHMLNDDQNTITLMGWNAEALKDCTAVHDAHYPLESAGIWADCVRERKTVVHNDYQSYPARQGLPDGHFPLYRHMSTPVLHEGKIRLILGVGNKQDPYSFNDISQLEYIGDEIQRFILRKQSQEEIARMNRELEQRVEKEVDRRLSQEQILIQQSRMAAMGEMIGAIAHQWKQPLTQLSLIVQDLQEAYETGEISREYMDKSVSHSLQSIDFLLKTIDDFKDFFKPARKKEEFYACETVQQTFNMMSAQLIKHNIELTIEEHEHFLSTGFQNEFKQVVMNLFNNARQAIDERGVQKGKIHVSFEKGEQMASILITDNAGGIPEELLPDRLFEPYVTTREENGTGIGLQICRMIVEDHMNGRITAENIEGGALFRITLPLSPENKTI